MKKNLRLMVSSNSAKDICICLIVVLMSAVIGRFYQEGDQKHYISAYEAIESADVFTGFLIYKSHLSTEEPVHYIITWVLSSLLGLNKLFAMSFFNGLLAFSYIKFVKNIGGSPTVAYIFVLTNYYFMVLYFAAERLKFAFIFFLLAMLFLNRSKLSYSLFFLAVLSHLQSLIVLTAPLFQRFTLSIVKIFRKRIIEKSFFLHLMILTLFISILLYSLGEYLLWKVPQYMGTMDLLAVWQSALFMLMTFFYVKKRGQIFLIYIPIIASSLIVGPERIVIMAFFVFTYYAAKYRGGLNYGIGLSSLYFGLKSFGFLVNIFTMGQGFSDIISE